MKESCGAWMKWTRETPGPPVLNRQFGTDVCGVGGVLVCSRTLLRRLTWSSGWTMHPEAFGLAEPGLLLFPACNFRAVDEIENQFHQRASVYNPPARAVNRSFSQAVDGAAARLRRLWPRRV